MPIVRFSYAESMIDPSLYAPLVQAAEKAGFDGFIVPDSIAYPQEGEDSYPYNADGNREFLEDKPFIEPFSLIPALAAVTETIRFNTFVVKLPIRNPVLVAKQVTSVGVITNNRFAFGVGTSPWREDYDLTQIPWERRGARMDECMEIITGFQTGEFFGYQGEFYNFEPAKMCPVPSTPVPMLVGGHSKMGLERAGRLSDGWMHAGADPEQVPAMMQEVNDARKAAGRLDRDFEFHVASVDAYSPEGLERLEAAGVTDVNIGFRDPYNGEPDTQSLDEKISMIQWYADEVMSKFR